jgi:hypothetical protein
MCFPAIHTKIYIEKLLEIYGWGSMKVVRKDGIKLG